MAVLSFVTIALVFSSSALAQGFGNDPPVMTRSLGPSSGFGSPGGLPSTTGAFPDLPTNLPTETAGSPFGGHRGRGRGRRTRTGGILPGGGFGNFTGGQDGATGSAPGSAPAIIPTPCDGSGNLPGGGEGNGSVPESTPIAIPTPGSGLGNSPDSGDDEQDTVPDSDDGSIPTFVATPGVPFGGDARPTPSGFLSRKRAAATEAL